MAWDRYSRYTSTGGDTVFAYSWEQPDEGVDNLRVEVVRIATPTVSVLLIEDTDYTVADRGVDVGGSITLIGTYAAGLLVNDTISLESILLPGQFTIFDTAESFNATSVNNEFERRVFALEDVRRLAQRSVKVSPESPETFDGEFTPVASSLLAINLTGDGITLIPGGTGPLGGSTGAVDNAVLRADGILGNALQNSGVIVDDSDNVTGVNTINIGASIAITSMLDEDTMTSDSATAVATQQSIKAYVDTTVGATDHGGLAGLADDDHSQYSLVTGARSFTGTVTIGTGDLLITAGGITANADADDAFTFGRALIDSRVTDMMFLSHVDMSAINDRAMSQSALGATVINSSTGTAVTTAVNGVPVGIFTNVLFNSLVAAQFDGDVDVAGDLDVEGTAEILRLGIGIGASATTQLLFRADAIARKFVVCVNSANTSETVILQSVDNGGAGHGNVEIRNSSNVATIQLHGHDGSADFTGVIRADNGSSTVPSITFVGQLTSGFACNGNAIEFITLGANRGSVNSGGKFDWEGAMDVLGTLTAQNLLISESQARYLLQTSIGTTGSVSWDIADNPSGKTVLTGNLTITAINNILINSNAVLYVQQNASAKTITWPSTVDWVGGSAPDLSTNSAKYLISFFSYDGTNVVGTVISDFS